MAAVKSLCKRAILLATGKLMMDESAATVVTVYLEDSTQIPSERVWIEPEKAPGNEKVRVRAVRVVNMFGQLISQVDIENPVIVEVEYQVLVPGTILNVSLSVFNQEDVYVLASPSTTDANWFQQPHPRGLFLSRCTIPGNLLNAGMYSFTVLLVERGQSIVVQLDKVVSVEMIDLGGNRGSYFGYWGGVVRPSLDWKTKRQSEGS